MPSRSPNRDRTIAGSFTFIILAFLVLRVIAAVAGHPIRTWDDEGYRWAASHDPSTGWQSIVHLLTPDPRNMATLGHIPRTIGYHHWLVLACRLAGPDGNAEQAWEWLNVGFYFATIGALFVTGWLATGRMLLASALAAAFASSPMLFGLSRWRMTENHVIFALAVQCMVASALLRLRELPPLHSRKRELFRRVLVGLASGYVTGVFSTLREYAAPYYVIAALLLVLPLVADGFWLTATAYLAAFAPFLAALSKALPPVLEVARQTATNGSYFHPLFPWLLHEVVWFWGIGLAAILVCGFAAVIACTARATIVAEWRGTAAHPSARDIYAVGLCAVALLGAAQIATLVHRGVRAGIPIMFLVLAAVIAWDPRRVLLRVRSQASILTALAVLIALQSALTIASAFESAERAAAFRHDCHALEYMNYPIRIPLLPPGRMHVRCDS